MVVTRSSWWGALTAIIIVGFPGSGAAQPAALLSRHRLSQLPLDLAWIGRTLFLYHYMAGGLLRIRSAGGVARRMLKERAEPWEHFALLLTMTPVFFLGMPATWAWISFIVVIGAYCVFLLKNPYAGRSSPASSVLVSLVLFVYYFPIWVGMPISRSGYYARMWLQAAVPRSWI